MELLEQIARAALTRDHLTLRSLIQDWVRSGAHTQDFSRPSFADSRLLVISAAIVELLAERRKESPPAWTTKIGSLSEPFFMLESASSMKCLRALCETQSPEPMRKRLLYAPPHFLEFA